MNVEIASQECLGVLILMNVVLWDLVSVVCSSTLCCFVEVDAQRTTDGCAGPTLQRFDPC